MFDLFPGVKTFLIVLAIIFFINAIAVMVGIPYVPFGMSVAFLAWLVWGLIGAVVNR